MNEAFEAGPNAPLYMEVRWGGKLGWRVVFQQKLYGPHTSTVIFKRREPKFWDALLYAKVIVEKDTQSKGVFEAVMAS